MSPILSTVPDPRVLTAEELRALDAAAEHELLLPPAVLMENASLNAANIVADLQPRSVLIIAGTGNNGGDGLALTRHLATRGLHARAILLGSAERCTPATRINLHATERLGLMLDQTRATPRVREHLESGRYETVIDALIGTGLSRPLAGDHAEVIRAINASRESKNHRTTIALDIPSGLRADPEDSLHPQQINTQQIDAQQTPAAIVADTTITFAAAKHALLPHAPDAHTAGDIIIVPIGLPNSFIERFGAPLTPGIYRDRPRAANALRAP